MLPDYKRWYVESESSLELVDSALGLLGIGLRQRGTAAEVRKALARENRAAAEGRPAAATIPQIQSIIEELTALVFDRPEDCAQLHVALGRMHVTKKTEDADDLPEDIARLLAVNSPATFVSSREGLVLIFASLPWVSRAQPEDLYWPTEHLEAIRQKWHPEQAASVLRDTQVANQQPNRHESRLSAAATSHVRAARARSTSVAMGSAPRAGYLSRPEGSPRTHRRPFDGRPHRRSPATNRRKARVLRSPRWLQHRPPPVSMARQTRPEIRYRHGGEVSRW